ncbi:MAG: flagellar export chaperone FliS [Oscillospiraceae bacterium]|nr:flagellar export chaperone FliS [Oscillospiraceae bacterium]
MVNPYAQYKKSSVETMTPVEVVIKLYSEIEKQCAIGMDFVEKKNFAKSNDAFIKAEDCIFALRESLDMSIPISQNLDDLYVFFYNTIVKANINKDLTDLKKVVPMIGELRDAWTQISQMTREEIEAQDKANRGKKKKVGE